MQILKNSLIGTTVPAYRVRSSSEGHRGFHAEVLLIVQILGGIHKPSLNEVGIFSVHVTAVYEGVILGLSKNRRTSFADLLRSQTLFESKSLLSGPASPTTPTYKCPFLDQIH